MNVLVTGGAGYIGSHLVSALRQAGNAVRVLDLRTLSGEHSADPGCDFIQGNVADRRLDAQVVRDVEAVHHLAWRFYQEFHPEEERREVQENIVREPDRVDRGSDAGDGLGEYRQTPSGLAI
jgi:nucleoside-diphosphate-sugar epimerase